jgi:hypothetical protein
MAGPVRSIAGEFNFDPALDRGVRYLTLWTVNRLFQSGFFAWPKLSKASNAIN